MVIGFRVRAGLKTRPTHIFMNDLSRLILRKQPPRKLHRQRLTLSLWCYLNFKLEIFFICMAERCEIVGCVGFFDFFEVYGFGLLHQVDGFAGDGGRQTEAGGAVFGFGEADVDVADVFGARKLVDARDFGGDIFAAKCCVVDGVVAKFFVGLYLFRLINLGQGN